MRTLSVRATSLDARQLSSRALRGTYMRRRLRACMRLRRPSKTCVIARPRMTERKLNAPREAHLGSAMERMNDVARPYCLFIRLNKLTSDFAVSEPFRNIALSGLQLRR